MAPRKSSRWKQVAAGQEFPLVKRTVSWARAQTISNPPPTNGCRSVRVRTWGQDAAEFAYVPDAAFGRGSFARIRWWQKRWPP